MAVEDNAPAYLRIAKKLGKTCGKKAASDPLRSFRSVLFLLELFYM
jgi:hypothetical protein